MSSFRDEKTAAALKARSETDFETLFKYSPNAYILLTPDLTIRDVNEAQLGLIGRHWHDLAGLPLFDAFPDKKGPGKNDDLGAEQIRGALARVLTERAPETLPLIHYPISLPTAADELEDRYWSLSFTPILDASGNVQLILQHTLDITELHEFRQASDLANEEGDAAVNPASTEASIFRPLQMVRDANQALDNERRRLRRLFEQAPGFICILRGPEHVFELANAAYCRLVDRDPTAKTVRQALPELEGQPFFDLLDRVYATAEPFAGRAEPVALQRRSDGPPEQVYVDFVYQPITEADGSVSGIFVQGHDVSEAHQLARELSYQATHDHLTGLLNRREFERRLTEAVEDAQRTRTHHCLLYLNLDQFKVVNNTCGHAAGDALLRHVSELLRTEADEMDTIGRLGGDEFGILLSECSSETAKNHAETLRARVADTEFFWERRAFGLNVSIGVIDFTGNDFTHQEVLSTAGSACYLAKEKGRNRVHVHYPADVELRTRRQEMEWVRKLRIALQEERLVLYSQRIRALGEQDPAADRQEILVRLTEVDGSLVGPTEFIPAAERYNLMPQIDRYVVQGTFKHLAGLPGEQRGRMIYSINLSGKTFNDESFLRFLHTQVAEYAVAPSQICFEITETAAIDNLATTARMIYELKASGFMFALDDFGSGMSSYGYLKSLPVDLIKIDGKFVTDILDDPVGAAMVEAIAKIARLMGIKTVAEYAENDAVLELLGSLGVDFAQGYGVHRPEPLGY